MLSNTETVASLLNGMIGGTILVLPLLALHTGYIAAILIAIGMGLASAYTARLITLHMGDCKSVNECLVRHFGQSIVIRVLYNSTVVIGIIPTLMAYFRLIVMQLEGLFGTENKNILAIAALLTMAIAIVVIRFYDWGQKLMGYGIVSIISYLIFMLWAQVTAPHPKGSVPSAFGQGYSQLAISLMMAYSIHDFMVQIIVRNPNKKTLRSLMGLVFLLGGIVYCYVALGCFAIYARSPIKRNPETIIDYFPYGSVPVMCLNLLYVVHLITVYPEFAEVARLRIDMLFNLSTQNQTLPISQPGPQNNSDVLSNRSSQPAQHPESSNNQGHSILRNPNFKLWEIAYYIVILTLSFFAFIYEVRLTYLISFSGMLTGIGVMITMPLYIHCRCVYFGGVCLKDETLGEEGAPADAIIEKASNQESKNVSGPSVLVQVEMQKSELKDQPQSRNSQNIKLPLNQVAQKENSPDSLMIRNNLTASQACTASRLYKGRLERIIDFVIITSISIMGITVLGLQIQGMFQGTSF